MTAGLFFDWDGDGFATGANDDCTAYLIRASYRRGSGPEIIGSAQIGSATFILKNTSGLFNPDNSGGALYGKLRDGVPVWFGINTDGTLGAGTPKGRFAGRITDITPVPATGATDAPTVEIVCEDALGWYGRSPATTDTEVTAQGALRAQVLDAIGEAAGRRDLADEVDPLAIGYVSGTGLDLLEAINHANGTRHFIHPADIYTDWFDYTTRDRHYKNGASAVDVTISGSSDRLIKIDGWRLTADTVINRQTASIDWPIFPGGHIIVWTWESSPFDVTTTVPFELDVQYPDYVRSPRLVVASSGATLVATLTDHGYGGHISLTVASGTAVVSDVTVWGLEAVRSPQQTARADNGTSQALPRGIRAGPAISGDLVGTIRSAEGITGHVVWRYANPQKRPVVTLKNWTAGLSIDLYDLVAVTSGQLDATTVRFEIVSLAETVEMAASPSAFLFTTILTLQEARLQSAFNWFVLGASTLNGTHQLAY